MIAVHIIAGDADGGPHAEVVLDLDREAEEVTDAECADWRIAVQTMYRESFGEDPESVIVWIDEMVAESREQRP